MFLNQFLIEEIVYSIFVFGGRKQQTKRRLNPIKQSSSKLSEMAMQVKVRLLKL